MGPDRIAAHDAGTKPKTEPLADASSDLAALAVPPQPGSDPGGERQAAGDVCKSRAGVVREKNQPAAAALGLAEAAVRALNPFSAQRVLSGEPHPRGHWPLKKRALVWTLMCGSTFCWGGDGYEPRVGVLRPEGACAAAAADPPVVDPHRSIERCCREVLASYDLSGVHTVGEFLQRVPELKDDPRLRQRFGSLSDIVSPETVEHTILSLDKYAMRLDEARVKFPQLEESVPFHFFITERRTDGPIPLVFLRYCESSLEEETMSEVREELARELRGNLEENVVFRSIEKNPLLGPKLDRIIAEAAELALQISKKRSRSEDVKELRGVVMDAVRSDMSAEEQTEFDRHVERQPRRE